jgi:hypothetical protein
MVMRKSAHWNKVMLILATIVRCLWLGFGVGGNCMHWKSTNKNYQVCLVGVCGWMKLHELEISKGYVLSPIFWARKFSLLIISGA